MKTIDKVAILAVCMILGGFLYLNYMDISQKEKEYSIKLEKAKEHAAVELKNATTSREKLDILKTNCELYILSGYTNRCIKDLAESLEINDG